MRNALGLECLSLGTLNIWCGQPIHSVDDLITQERMTGQGCPKPLFRYGVAFIGYTVASCLALVATIGD